MTSFIVIDVYPGQPPPPYDSQGETYRLVADDEADTSPMGNVKQSNAEISR